MSFRTIAVGQHLSEEDVVIGPDGEEVLLVVVLGIHKETLVSTRRDGSCRIAEVAVGKAILDVHGNYEARRRRIRQEAR